MNHSAETPTSGSTEPSGGPAFPRATVSAGQNRHDAAAPPTGFAEPGAPFDPQADPDAAAPHSEAEIAAAAEVFVGMRLVQIERAVIEATIRAYDGSLPRAARVLGLSASTLYRKRARWADQSGAD
jgi:DNA-binding NtrC family response regulator